MKKRLLIPLFTVITTAFNIVPSVFANAAPTPAWITTWTIEPRDTLYQIARSTDTPLQLLESTNPTLNPSNLKVGQVVNVPRTWIVAKGNTLYQVAHTLGVSVQSIADINGLSNQDLIYPGQVLLIPQQTVANGASVYGSWTVQPGDTLWEISQTTGVSVNQLASLNAVSAEDLPVGRVLLVPPTDMNWSQRTSTPLPTKSTPNPAAVSIATIEVTMPVTTLVENSTQPYEVDVTALDASGNPVSDASLNVLGSAWANATQITTDRQGHAQFTIDAGNQLGDSSVEVQDPNSGVQSVVYYTVVAGN